jgi:DNA-binding GntR family transcriptional regulator
LNKLFQTISAEMRLLMALLRAHYPDISTLRDEHTELLQALDRRDSDEALRLWAAHLEDAEMFLSGRILEEQPSTT